MIQLILAICLFFGAGSAARAGAIDRLDNLDSSQRTSPLSQIEWLYNIGTVKTTAGRRFSILIVTTECPEFDGFIPGTLLPIVNGLAAPQITVQVLDLDRKKQYAFSTTTDNFDPSTFSAIAEAGKVSVIRRNDGSAVRDLRTDSVVTDMLASGTTPDHHTFSLRLSAVSTKSRAAFGTNGWVDNGTLGKALYLSRTARILDPRTAASLQIDGETFILASGAFWEDHQVVNFTTSSIGTNIRWNWFAAEFDDQSDMMMYQLENGSTGEVIRNFAAHVLADGSVEEVSDLSIEAVSTVHSDGHSVPSAWRITSPSLGLDLSARHDVTAPWLKMQMGLVKGEMLEGPASTQGRASFGAADFLWAEYFDSGFFGLGL